MCVVVERSPRSAGGRDDLLWLTATLRPALMELSKLYANSLFPRECRCTALRCTAHTHMHEPHIHAACFLAQGIMGTQIFIRTMVFFKGNMRRDKSNCAFGGCSSINKHFVPTASHCHLFHITALFSLQSQHRAVFAGAVFGLTPGVWNTTAILHLGTQWEKLSYFSLVLSEEGVHFLQGGSCYYQTKLCKNSQWKSGYWRQGWFLTGTIHHTGPRRVSGARLFMVGRIPPPPPLLVSVTGELESDVIKDDYCFEKKKRVCCYRNVI